MRSGLAHATVVTAYGPAQAWLISDMAGFVHSRRSWIAAAIALALCAGGCGGNVRKEAARDARALLLAAESGDAETFEAHIDREALRADLKAQLLTLPEIRALQSQLGEEVGDVAADRMISPEAVRETDAGVGRAPSLKQVSAALEVLDRKRVCLRDPEDKARCVLTFEKQARGWRLTALNATDLRAQIPEGS